MPLDKCPQSKQIRHLRGSPQCRRTLQCTIKMQLDFMRTIKEHFAAMVSSPESLP